MFRSTLPRGSDAGETMRQTVTTCFDPRSREGATGIAADLAEMRPVSIHAPARERQAGRPPASMPRCFDPRSREGATRLRGQHVFIDDVSIHAPARERPLNMSRALPTSAVSIHAPARERQPRLPSGNRQRCFDPRSREGATITARRSLRVILVSIHAPARERPVLQA